MGLDIYKLNPSHEKTDFYFIKDESAEENKYRSQLFLVFKDYLKKEKKDFISWKETFEKKDTVRLSIIAKHVREKLREIAGNSDYIYTVRSIGYKFKESC